MFDPTDAPRVFGVPLGVDFPKALVDGLLALHERHPPEALARVHLIVNTRRMARRIREMFDQGPALLLPRISLVTDLGEDWAMADLPDAVPPLQRRLELLTTVERLLDQSPDLAPRAALYDLSDSLAALMDEMHGEGVPPEVIEDLDITDQSGHWERIKAFLGIVRPYFDTGQAEPDVETRQRMVIERLIAQWAETPPDHPVIIAGSTGSRGATQMLMQAVARLPQGAIVFPGFDADMPEEVWETLETPLTSEDHPQYRFAQFMAQLGGHPRDVAPWPWASRPVSPERNKVISLALRPAPVTDQWLRDGPNLPDLTKAMANVTLLEADSTRQEALTIAMRLRKAAEDQTAAALITPDRTLTRQVTALLDRWGIIPDDSAGMPLQLSVPGRFLRHVADLMRNRLTADSLLTLLKHPLTHTGVDRGPHLRLTRELELHLRRYGPPFPDAESLSTWAAARKEPEAAGWVAWIRDCFCDKELSSSKPLTQLVTDHIALAERIAQGPDGDGAGTLWDKEAGREALKAVTELRDNAKHGGALNAPDYANLFTAVLNRGEVRNPDTPHPYIRIWGTLEARVQGADLLILAGLNEGSWPEAPKPDPWLNRKLRNEAGLLLPERRIGLSAHDFQQAASAPEVWMTRAIRSDDAETVVSRWLNRLQNLLDGLPDRGGKEALAAMRARGQHWLSLAEQLEDPGQVTPATRPAPIPPATARPRKLSVTEIKTLIRDPYAIYAKHVLGLRPLDPLMKAPDALLRGTVLHKVLEEFIRDTLNDPGLLTRDHLIAQSETILAQNVPWPEVRAMWLARMERVADWILDTESTRRARANPTLFEEKGSAELPSLGFTLTGTADRIDMDETGQLYIYDYKTGAAPTKDQQTHFDKQLLLEAAMAEQSGFGQLAPNPVAGAYYLSLNTTPKEVEAPLAEEPVEKVWQEFEALIAAYLDETKSFPSRRAMFTKDMAGNYDQLARFGEWDITDDPDEEPVT
ncbi:double-strand break repair protein AddB [Roseovarius sp. A21]|uniref:Double-strand break repair protein AddB n=1 Tax=Roseovarius bejariae TaxID=2576383 RepID=A0A844CLI4_9RHOB|nr:double-strand break repair protein AddB [Roseovarius bejariae]MRU15502.1 double-strand break repair protein AddB [Roseovarius bejariae]